jgi:hypothetical protein
MLLLNFFICSSIRLSSFRFISSLIAAKVAHRANSSSSSSRRNADLAGDFIFVRRGPVH